MDIRWLSWLPAALVAGACATHTGPTGADAASASPGDPGAAVYVSPPPSASDEGTNTMQLGNFCVCLAVKDLAASLAFYEKLGFTQVSGDAAQHWLVLKNGVARIGLFERYIDKTTLTFNPGWTPDAQPLSDFEDVRELQRKVLERGLEPSATADPDSTGPAYFILEDPDGNPIFVDQHVPRPRR